MKKILVIAAAAVLVSVVAAANAASTFESVTAGFRVVKPEGWRFASLDEVSRNRATARLKDEELQRFVQEQASAPLVVLMKHEEPYDALNPSFQVLLRPLPPALAQSKAKEILGLILPTLEKSFQEFTLEAPIRELEVSGHAAAELTARYSVANADGRVFPTRARMLVVPRGQFMFLMSGSAPPEGPDVSKAEFDAIVASIVIDD